MIRWIDCAAVAMKRRLRQSPSRKGWRIELSTRLDGGSGCSVGNERHPLLLYWCWLGEHIRPVYPPESIEKKAVYAVSFNQIPFNQVLIKTLIIWLYDFNFPQVLIQIRIDRPVIELIEICCNSIRLGIIQWKWDHTAQ